MTSAFSVSYPTEWTYGPMSLDKALAIAVMAHRGQKDKGGNSYILHPLRVMTGMDTEDSMVVAVLHDVCEDTPVTLHDLAHWGCTEGQLQAIDALTKRESETYEEMIERASQSSVATKVKIADLTDNLSIFRLKSKVLTEKDMARMQKYINALIRLGGLRRG